MSDYIELIKKTLSDVNSLFDVACKDLHSEVRKVNSAIEQYADGNLHLALTRTRATADFSIFDLVLSSDSAQKLIVVGSYKVPFQGYPIHYGNFDYLVPDIKGYLYNSTDVVNHFAGMMSDTSSAIVMQMAFLSRLE